jgi:hypothetical protein
LTGIDGEADIDGETVGLTGIDGEADIDGETVGWLVVFLGGGGVEICRKTTEKMDTINNKINERKLQRLFFMLFSITTFMPNSSFWRSLSLISSTQSSNRY